MALNITFDGYIYLEDGTLAGGNIKYQGLFYPNGTASSSTKWNNVRISEVSSYYNINLGDGDWLTQDGTALNNSKVLIVFWLGDTLDRNSLCLPPNNLEQWGVLELTLDGSSVYTNNVQIRSNINPNAVGTLTANGYVGDSYLFTNNSNDEHQWLFNGVTMHHYRRRFGQDIQLINTIAKTSFYWDDGTSDLNLSGASSRSHIWNSPGIYNVRMVVYDECDGFSELVEQITIRNKQPVPDITCLQTANNIISVPNTIVTFRYSGTDPNDAITSIDWVIHDNGSFGNTNTSVTANRDDIISHSSGNGTSWCGQAANPGAFTNPGDHIVSIDVNWNDGFDDLVVTYNETFTQSRFSGPSIDFTQDPAQASISGTVSFANVSSNVDRVGTGLPNCFEYDWYLYYGSTEVDNVLNVDKSYVYTVQPTTIDASVKLCANWNDGWDNKYTCKTDKIVFETTISVIPEDCYYILDINGTAPDGTIHSYKWDIYQDTTVSGGSGPWERIWSSPNNIDQKTKKIGFTDLGYFKITGYIYGDDGSYDSASDIIYVYEVCPSAEHIIWDGTGPLDKGKDWNRHGVGVETTYAAHSGTNGLHATMSDNNYIKFTKFLSTIDTTQYESLVLWVNVRKLFNVNSDIKIKLRGLCGSGSVKLSNYITINSTDKWQKAIINLEDFNLSSHTRFINTVDLVAIHDIEIYLDDVAFGAVKVERLAVQVCKVDMNTDLIGTQTIQGREMLPSLKGIKKFPKPKLT